MLQGAGGSTNEVTFALKVIEDPGNAAVIQAFKNRVGSAGAGLTASLGLAGGGGVVGGGGSIGGGGSVSGSGRITGDRAGASPRQQRLDQGLKEVERDLKKIEREIERVERANERMWNRMGSHVNKTLSGIEQIGRAFVLSGLVGEQNIRKWIDTLAAFEAVAQGAKGIGNLASGLGGMMGYSGGAMAKGALALGGAALTNPVTIGAGLAGFLAYAPVMTQNERLERERIERVNKRRTMAGRGAGLQGEIDQRLSAQAEQFLSADDTFIGVDNAGERRRIARENRWNATASFQIAQRNFSNQAAFYDDPNLRQQERAGFAGEMANAAGANLSAVDEEFRATQQLRQEAEQTARVRIASAQRVVDLTRQELDLARQRLGVAQETVRASQVRFGELDDFDANRLNQIGARLLAGDKDIPTQDLQFARGILPNVDRAIDDQLAARGRERIKGGAFEQFANRLIQPAQAAVPFAQLANNLAEQNLAKVTENAKKEIDAFTVELSGLARSLTDATAELRAAKKILDFENRGAEGARAQQEADLK